MTATNATLYRYRVSYRRSDPSSPVYTVWVTARDADDARRVAALADPSFGSTVASPRRLGEAHEPEGADGLTSAKALALLDEGTAVFEDDEWTNREGMPEFNGAFR